MYAYHLPHAGLSNLIDIFVSLSKLNDDLYSLNNLDDFKFLAGTFINHRHLLIIKGPHQTWKKINLSELNFLQRLLNTFPWPWGLGTSFAVPLSIGGCHWFAPCSWKLHGGSAAANFWLMTGSVTRSGSTTFRFPYQSSTSFTWKPFMTSLTYTYGYHTGTVSNWIWYVIPLLWCSHGVVHVLLKLNANFREL